jgi:myosin-5
MKNSHNSILQQIFSSHNHVKGKSVTMLHFFEEQLKELMKLLNKSYPYYIRCIKPNNNKKAKEFDSVDVMR